MATEKDKKNRNELKEVINRSTKISQELKAKLLAFAEELENGSLEKLLTEMKERVDKECSV